MKPGTLYYEKEMKYCGVVLEIFDTSIKSFCEVGCKCLNQE